MLADEMAVCLVDLKVVDLAAKMVMMRVDWMAELLVGAKADKSAG